MSAPEDPPEELSPEEVISRYKGMRNEIKRLSQKVQLEMVNVSETSLEYCQHSHASLPTTTNPAPLSEFLRPISR